MPDQVPVSKPIRRLFELLKLERRDIGRIYLYAIFAGIINLSLPLGIQSIINFIQSGQISTSWIVLVLFVMTGIVIAGVLQIFQMYISDKISQRLFSAAAFEIAWKIPKLNLRALENLYPPELVNRFFDVITLQKGLSKILMDFTAALLQVFFGLILLSLYHPLFIALSLFTILFFAAVYRFTIPRGLQTNLAESKYKYETVHWLQELAGSLVSFKLAGKSALHIERTDLYVTKYLDARHKHFRILALQYGFTVILKLLVAGGLLVAGSILVLDNQMNLGQFVAAEIIILLISSSIDKLIIGLETVYDVLTAVEKIDQLTGLPIDDEPEHQLALEDEKSGMRVSLQKAGLTFPDADKPVLREISLTIESCQRVVVGGWNGSGRSAFLQLVSGNYLATSGSVSLDGVPIRNLKPDSFRSQTGNFLFQEQIFHGTLLENIALGRENADFRAVERSIQQVGLTQWVEALPNGYQTQLNPDGHKLDKNTISKILIARAICGEPRLLLLEFPMNDIHPDDSEQLRSVFFDKTIPWTLIAVTENLELAKCADRIIVFKDGRIFADGTHLELSKMEWYETVFHS